MPTSSGTPSVGSTRWPIVRAFFARARPGGARLSEVWSIEPDDVILARDLAASHPSLSARDLLHRACCLRRDVEKVETFDRALSAAFQD